MSTSFTVNYDTHNINPRIIKAGLTERDANKLCSQLNNSEAEEYAACNEEAPNTYFVTQHEFTAEGYLVLYWLEGEPEEDARVCKLLEHEWDAIRAANALNAKEREDAENWLCTPSGAYVVHKNETIAHFDNIQWGERAYCIVSGVGYHLFSDGTGGIIGDFIIESKEGEALVSISIEEYITLNTEADVVMLVERRLIPIEPSCSEIDDNSGRFHDPREDNDGVDDGYEQEEDDYPEFAGWIIQGITNQDRYLIASTFQTLAADVTKLYMDHEDIEEISVYFNSAYRFYMTWVGAEFRGEIVEWYGNTQFHIDITIEKVGGDYMTVRGPAHL
jgi:hypothetical protein